MRIPKFLSASILDGRLSVATGGVGTLSGRDYRNDGDYPLAITDVYFGGLNLPASMEVWFKPSRGPAWSPRPVPAILLPNLTRGVGAGFAVDEYGITQQWHLANPFWLEPHDAIEIQVYNRHATEALVDISIGLTGYKNTELKRPPKERWIPQIYSFTQIPSTGNIANGQQATIPPTDLQNLDGQAVILHALSVFTHDGTDELDFDELQLKAKLNGNPWMRDNDFTSIGCMRTYRNRQIPLPNIPFVSSDTLLLTLQNNHGSEAFSNIAVALIGSLKVEG